MKKIIQHVLIALTLFFPSLDGRSQTWSLLNSGISTRIAGVSIVDANICYVTGFQGKILKTTDGGATWIPQISGTSQDLFSIRFTDANNGIAVGSNGALRRTTDGGANWTGINLTTDALRYVYFFDSNIGYITGGLSTAYGSIFKTTDGGATWSPLTISSANIIYRIKFTSATDGYACDYTGAIFKTINGGTTWTLSSSGVSSPLYGIDFTSATDGIVIGDLGVIRRTTNSGSSWSGVFSGTNHMMTGFKFSDSSNGYAVGGNATANTGMIVSTNDGGATWSVYTSGTSRLYDVDFLNTNIGYVVGLDGVILKYSNGVGITEQTDNKLLINAYPNPSLGEVTIDLSTLKAKKNISIELFDLTGKLHRKYEAVSGDNFVIEKGDLNSGIYLFNVSELETVVGTGKIVFE